MPEGPQQMIVPTLRYADVATAVEWLTEVFGFQVVHRAVDGDGDIQYAQLRLGQSLLMLGRLADNAIAGIMAQPDEIGGRESQICYLRVADPEAARRRVEATGAEILLSYGGSDTTSACYACRDPDGHIWNFGSYDPVHPPVEARRQAPRRRSAALHTALGVTLAANLLALAGLAGLALPGGSERALWSRQQLVQVAGWAHRATAGGDHAGIESRTITEPGDDARIREQIVRRETAAAAPPEPAAPTLATDSVAHIALLPARHNAPPATLAARCAARHAAARPLAICNAHAERHARLASFYSNRGIGHYLEGRHQRAVGGLTLAIARAPRVAETYVARGLAFVGLHNHQRADDDFTAAIAIAPEHALAHAHRGAVRLARGDHGAAIADLGKAVLLDPTLRGALADRAIALIAADRPVDAVPDAARLLAHTLDSPTLLMKRARIMAALGNNRAALEDMERADEITAASSRALPWPLRIAETP